MKYKPFCSVEVKFDTLQGLVDLINSCSKEEPTVVVADRLTTDIWGISHCIDKGVKDGYVAWVDKCPSNPTQREVISALEIAGDLNPDKIIAIGGGSSIDVGKSISALYYIMKGKNPDISMITEAIKTGAYKTDNRFIDIIAVPSTAGTGSEVTSFATVWDVGKEAKYSIDCPENYPKQALMIPELMLTLPARLTLSTGLDALSHAMESFWAKPTTYLVKDTAARAIDMIMTYLPKTLKEPGNLELRTAMSRAALLAGISFAVTRTTACHSMGYPMTMQYGVEHGFACALTMDAVSKINRSKTLLAEMLFEIFERHGGLQNWIDETCGDIIRLRLCSFGIPESGIDEIVQGTFTKGRMDNNPVDITPDQVRDILLSVYK